MLCNIFLVILFLGFLWYFVGEFVRDFRHFSVSVGLQNFFMCDINCLISPIGWAHNNVPWEVESVDLTSVNCHVLPCPLLLLSLSLMGIHVACIFAYLQALLNSSCYFGVLLNWLHKLQLYVRIDICKTDNMQCLSIYVVMSRVTKLPFPFDPCGYCDK